MGQSPTIRFPKGNPPAPKVGQTQASRNGRSTMGESSLRSLADDADACYAAALKLVQSIDRELQKGTRHYYDTRGRLLRTLDEVIHALLTDSLAPSKPAELLQGREAVEWVSADEMAA